MFYGPGGPYALFAGKDASRALAKMSFEEKDLTGDISGLGPFELDALQDWEYKFMSKYVKVGTIKTIPVTEGASTAESAEVADKDVPKTSEDGPSESTEAKTEETPSSVKPEDAEWARLGEYCCLRASQLSHPYSKNNLLLWGLEYCMPILMDI